MNFLPKDSAAVEQYGDLKYPQDSEKAKDALIGLQKGLCSYSERYLKPLDSVEVKHSDPRKKNTPADGFKNWHAVIRDDSGSDREGSLCADEVAGHCFSDGLTGVGLVVAEAWTGIYFKAPSFAVVFLDAEVNTGEGKVQFAGEPATSVGEFCGEIEGFQGRFQSLTAGIAIVGGSGNDARGEDFVSNHMYTDIAAWHAALKLHGTPANGIETNFIISAERPDHGSDAAGGLVDEFPVPVTELTYGGGVVGDECFRREQAGGFDEPRLPGLGTVRGICGGTVGDTRRCEVEPEHQSFMLSARIVAFRCSGWQAFEFRQLRVVHDPDIYAGNVAEAGLRFLHSYHSIHGAASDFKVQAALRDAALIPHQVRMPQIVKRAGDHTHR